MILHERKKEERFVKIMEEGNALFGSWLTEKRA